MKQKFACCFKKGVKRLDHSILQGVFRKSFFCWRFYEFLQVWFEAKGGKIPVEEVDFRAQFEIVYQFTNLQIYELSFRETENHPSFDEVCWICMVLLLPPISKVGSCHWALQYDRGLCSLWLRTFGEGAFEGSSLYLIHIPVDDSHLYKVWQVSFASIFGPFWPWKR